MTKRQQKIALVVAERREEILAQADDLLRKQPIGYSAQLRHYLDFRRGALHLIITKVPNGYCWYEDNPLFFHRKGRTPPRAHAL